jgi:OmpA-OmpF porin, OOP family
MSNLSKHWAFLAVVSLVAFSGCANYEVNSNRGSIPGYYIRSEMQESDRAVEAARNAGKDKTCPAEFKAAEDAKNNAYDVFRACHTEEGVALAKKATAMANALCPPVAKVVVVEPPPPPPSPTVSLSADPDSVKQGKCATLTWSSTNASRVSIDKGIGNVDPSGTKQVCPVSTTPYTISVAGDGGSQTATTTVNVIPLKPKTIVFETAALFDFDKSDLKPEGKEQIKAYREEAKEELSRADKITITGHTDNIGAPDYNMKLSLRRAESVRDYLASIGIDPKKLEVRGEGESKPIADNSTDEGRAKNRRVEVDIYGLEK